ALKTAQANLAFPCGPGVFYDALVGGQLPYERSPENHDVFLAGGIRFGPGQMRVFAHTRLSIAGVKLATPVLGRDLVVEKEPIAVDIAGSLVDLNGGLVSGSVPVHIKIVDPLGVTRHELFRATKLGQFSIRLPLAANDPPGEWKVVVREGLNN